MPFLFKHFSVEDTLSTQRIGTDAMLLGAWAEPGQAARILDIGTGCGVLALMMAQKSAAIIDAIDIDEPSVKEAAENFRNSPWANRLTAKLSPLQHWTSTPTHQYEYIITNPPYFSRALPSPVKRRNFARHDEYLSSRELIEGITSLLAPQGRLAIILPAREATLFTRKSNEIHLHLLRKTIVRSKLRVAPKRALMEFSIINTGNFTENELIIQGSNGKFTPEYLTLTADFHNF